MHEDLKNFTYSHIISEKKGKEKDTETMLLCVWLYEMRCLHPFSQTG